MLMAILDIFFRILIIVLLIRFFVETYQYYGYGPVLYAVMEATTKLLMPLRQIIPPASRLLHAYLPLTAIGLLILVRGFFIWLFGSWHPLSDIAPISGFSGLLAATGLSASMALLLIAELLILFLFASMMISRYGIMSCTSAGYACFQDKTFAIFQLAKRMIRTNDLLWLFLFSTLVIVVGAGLLSAVFTFSYMNGFAYFYAAMIVSMFDVLNNVIFLYTLVLLLSILSSWLGADNFSLMIQVLKAMTEPYLNLFRTYFPWARIDFIDLSPIFAFIVLNPVLVGLLYVLQRLLLELNMPGAGSSGLHMI